MWGRTQLVPSRQRWGGVAWACVCVCVWVGGVGGWVCVGGGEEEGGGRGGRRGLKKSNSKKKEEYFPARHELQFLTPRM